MESNNTKARKRSKLVRFVTAPFRILNKIYMASVSSCATGIENHGGGLLLTASSVAPQPVPLPRNFSVSSTKSEEEDDVRELIRVVSTRISTNGENNKVHDLEKLEEQGTGTGTNYMQASSEVKGIRSRSVGIGKLGKIDEESPVDFKDGDVKVVSYPRSRTYAAPGRVLTY